MSNYIRTGTDRTG
jgi:hypothetical protein